jgi:hypothetical protein
LFSSCVFKIMLVFYEWWQSFYGFEASECGRCPRRFIKNNYDDEKNPRKGGKNVRKHVLKMGCYFKS